MSFGTGGGASLTAEGTTALVLNADQTANFTAKVTANSGGFQATGISANMLMSDGGTPVITRNGSTGIQFLKDAYWQTFSIFTNNSERMRVASTGNLLINTTTDAGYKLDVNGSVRLQGTVLGSAATTAGTYGVALGYNAQGTSAHAIAIGYNALASANPSIALGYAANASAQYSTAFANSYASGNNSISFGNNSYSTGKSAMAGGESGYSYLQGQLAVGNYMSYVGDCQTSIYTGNLNTGIVSSGGTYSFAGIRPSNMTFGSDVSQIWYVECVIIFSVKGRTAAITEFSLRDTYSIKYKLAVKSNNSIGTTILGTPIADDSFSDASMATTSVTFTIVSNNLVVNVTPPTWASGGQMQFRGTASFQLTELGVYSQLF